MKLNISLWNKIKAFAALVTVFLLVLATNKMDKKHFIEVQKSFSSIYEDRLVAKEHIFKISRHLDNLKIDAIQYSPLKSNLKDSILVLVEKFSKTKLTVREEKHLGFLKTELDTFFQAEGFNNDEGLNKTSKEDLILRLNNVLEQLDILSEIQMLEAKREIDKSNKLIESSNLLSRLEIGALIFIGLIVQILIFVKPLK